MRMIIIQSFAAMALLGAVAVAEIPAPVESECVGFVNCPRRISTSHCTPVNFQFEAVNTHNEKPNRGIRYHLALGPGQIDERSGLWSFDPRTVTITEWGQTFRAVVVATQGNGRHSDTCKFSVRVYNNTPRPFYIGPYHKDSIPVIAGKHNMIPVWWLDRDSCDLIQKSFSFSSTAPGGSIFIDDDPNASTFPDVGNVIFFPNSADAGKSFVIHLTAFDGIDSSSLDFQLYVQPQVVVPSEYAVAIKKYPAVIQGQFVNVDVELQKSAMDLQGGGLGGFDLLIGYDASALSLQNVHYDSMSIFQLCDWEYFTYRPGVPANCTTGCPSGMVRVVGLAETNNGAHHPTCPPLNLPPNLPVTLFRMQFLVSNDPTFESLYIPIRFFWMDCGDNSIANWDGSQLHLARRVFDYWDYQTPLDSMYAVFPGYGGVPSDSCHPTDPWKPEPGRTVDFYNGSLFIISPDTIDARGDINLNNVPFELADCVMFSNYFTHGLAAFGSNPMYVQGSIAASDINKDGIPLTLADFVYMQHIIAGDANPVPPSPSTDTARLLFADQTLLLETPDTLGALRLVFEGEMVPELLAHHASISYTSGTPNTTVLISGGCESGAASLATGQLLNVTAGHRLISAEAATYEGGMIPVTFAPYVLPGEYAVRIEKKHDVIQGQFCDVDVLLLQASTDSAMSGLGGFDLLIYYDASAISLQKVDPGQFITDCKWEYFTYRYGANDSCGSACPSGYVRIVALAETNNGDNHPVCFTTNPELGIDSVVASMRFLISNDRALECQFIPIKFWWTDCNDNAFSNTKGDTLIISRYVYGYGGFAGPYYHIESFDPAFPTDAGAQEECDTHNIPGKPDTWRVMDFYNGGIDIICADSIDPRGDINLNGISYETSDCVMFGNYFMYGPSAFHGHTDGSTAASDVNADGIPLSLADYVYFQRIVIGDVMPAPVSSTDTVHLLLTNFGPSVVLATHKMLGALYLVFEGEVAPGLLVQNASMYYAQDSAHTRILISGVCGDTIPKIVSGAILNGTAGHRLISAEAATYEGGMIPVVVDYMTSADESTDDHLPASFALRQNYPNPFNAGTVISFDLPKASDVRLEIINITGQVVYATSSRLIAGSHTIAWDGNVNGHPVASGIYYYRLIAGDFSATKKMVLLK